MNAVTVATTTQATHPATSRAPRLLWAAANASLDNVGELSEVVGTNAITGANTPATLRSQSSAVVLPLITVRATPVATSAPTNTERVGV